MVAHKKERIQALCAQRLAGKPSHVELRELEEQMGKHRKAIKTLEDDTIPSLQQRLDFWKTETQGVLGQSVEAMEMLAGVEANFARLCTLAAAARAPPPTAALHMH